MIFEFDCPAVATVQDGGRAAVLSQQGRRLRMVNPQGSGNRRTEEANQQALVHFAVCQANPELMQKKAERAKEGTKELQHRQQTQEAAPAAAALRVATKPHGDRYVAGGLQPIPEQVAQIQARLSGPAWIPTRGNRLHFRILEIGHS